MQGARAGAFFTFGLRGGVRGAFWVSAGGFEVPGFCDVGVPQVGQPKCPNSKLRGFSWGALQKKLLDLGTTA